MQPYIENKKIVDRLIEERCHNSDIPFEIECGLLSCMYLILKSWLLLELVRKISSSNLARISLWAFLG